MRDISSWSKFHVRTLDQAALRKASEDLSNIAFGNFTPTIYLGIRTGGYVVAELMAQATPQPVRLLPITCRRPSTAKKNNLPFVKETLKRLPHFISDRLRIMEHIYLTQIKKPRDAQVVPDEAELSVLRQVLAEQGAEARVLVIDDSIDSGATVAAVLAVVRTLAHPAAQIKTAAVTITTAHPLVEPDFSLYRYALCRFPWSLDFKA